MTALIPDVCVKWRIRGDAEFLISIVRKKMNKNSLLRRERGKVKK